MKDTIKVFGRDKPDNYTNVEYIEIEYTNREMETYLAKDIDSVEESNYEIKLFTKDHFVNCFPKANILRYCYRLPHYSWMDDDND